MFDFLAVVINRSLKRIYHLQNRFFSKRRPDPYCLTPNICAIKKNCVHKKNGGKGEKTRVGILHGILRVEIEPEYDTVRGICG